ncbi:NADPH-dependent FMN reductase [Paenibacillus ginsengarvi]|uniref:NAD(P)H-dependent oxidoreductase n=1 Tax=Paenibacillus ginsengarvi TaxID=400777 RepID=A0A3B0CGS6_9BACL|nr:NADPH-dependent FMN reductase [Paenibacillus ginsengarvi]RKN85005.1 NAD(P)H-dependent oxidoreductase [Paenibacillus ginsengarvi]
MKVAIIAGSNKQASTSTKLCRYIAKRLEDRDCSVTLFDLYSRPVPLFTPDNRNPPDANLAALKEAMLRADAIVLSTPDYHGSISGVLKNAIDHLGFDHFDGKVVLSVCSTGGAVGVSPLQQLQVMVRAVHGINCPEWISIGGENRQFDEDGEPVSAQVKDRAVRAVDYFLRMSRQLRGNSGDSK